MAWLLNILYILGGLAVICVAGGYLLYRFIVVRRAPVPPPTDPQKVSEARRYFVEHYPEQLQWLENWGYETITLQSADGTPLVGYYFRAAQSTNRTALAVHGYRCNAFQEYLYFAPMYLEDLGMNLLLVDDYAHGNSGGKHIGFGWKDRLDCILWANWLAQRHGPECQVLLQGISMGAATVLMAAGDDTLPACVQWVVADCGYSSMQEEVCYIMKSLYHAPAFPLYHIGSAWCKLLAGYSFEDPNTEAYTRRCKIPVLFVHGTEDDFVPFSMVKKLYDACSAPKYRLIVPGAAHTESFLLQREAYVQHVQNLLATGAPPA